jgi:hypothetical protein
MYIYLFLGVSQKQGINRAVDDVTQQVASYMEKWINEYPDQVQYWNDIAATCFANINDKVNLNVKY